MAPSVKTLLIFLSEHEEPCGALHEQRHPSQFDASRPPQMSHVSATRYTGWFKVLRMVVLKNYGQVFLQYGSPLGHDRALQNTKGQDLHIVTEYLHGVDTATAFQTTLLRF